MKASWRIQNKISWPTSALNTWPWADNDGLSAQRHDVHVNGIEILEGQPVVSRLYEGIA